MCGHMCTSCHVLFDISSLKIFSEYKLMDEKNKKKTRIKEKLTVQKCEIIKVQCIKITPIPLDGKTI